MGKFLQTGATLLTVLGLPILAFAEPSSWQVDDRVQCPRDVWHPLRNIRTLVQDLGDSRVELTDEGTGEIAEGRKSECCNLSENERRTELVEWMDVGREVCFPANASPPVKHIVTALFHRIKTRFCISRVNDAAEDREIDLEFSRDVEKWEDACERYKEEANLTSIEYQNFRKSG